MTQSRRTAQRLAIRETLSQASGPLSVQEILEAGQTRVEGLGQATVYRYLKALEEEGWIVRSTVAGETAVYEVSDKPHHHHFHCRVCERVFDVPGCPIETESSVPKGFHVTGHEVILYGECAGCRG